MNNKIVCNPGCKDVVLPASFRRPCPLIQLNSWNELCGRPLRHGPEIKAAKQLFSHLKSFAIYTLSAWNLLCKVVLLPLTPRCGNYRHRPLAKLQNFLSINSRGVGGVGTGGHGLPYMHAYLSTVWLVKLVRSPAAQRSCCRIFSSSCCCSWTWFGSREPRLGALQPGPSPPGTFSFHRSSLTSR